MLCLFTLDHFLVLELETKLFAVFRAQNHNAVLLGKGRKAAGLGDQLQYAGLALSEYVPGLATSPVMKARLLRISITVTVTCGLLRKPLSFSPDQVLDLQRSHSAYFDFVNQRQMKCFRLSAPQRSGKPPAPSRP